MVIIIVALICHRRGNGPVRAYQRHLHAGCLSVPVGHRGWAADRRAVGWVNGYHGRAHQTAPPLFVTLGT